MWPFKRDNEIVQAQEQVESARELVCEAEERRRAVDRLVGHSRQVSARLRTEIATNGFTELFAQAIRRAQ